MTNTCSRNLIHLQVTAIKVSLLITDDCFAHSYYEIKIWQSLIHKHICLITIRYIRSTDKIYIR